MQDTTARKDPKQNDQPRTLSSLGSYLSSSEPTTHPAVSETTLSSAGGEDKDINGSESNADIAVNRNGVKEDNEQGQRQREKRLAMNRASARERRKRKRILIEELQEKSQNLTCANLQLCKVNEQLRGEVAQLTAILTATQPALASLLSSGGNISALSGGFDPSITAAAASQLAVPAGGNAGALAALQQQERARARLFEAEGASRAVSAAAHQISMPLNSGVPGAAVPSAQELAQQKMQRALLSQRIMGDGMGGGGGANQLLASIMGGAANSQATDVAALAQQALAGQLGGSVSSSGAPLDFDAIQRGRSVRLCFCVFVSLYRHR